MMHGTLKLKFTYRFFENPYIHEDKPSLSVCTLVYPVFPWCSGEVWGCALVSSLSISRIGSLKIHTSWGQTISQCLHFGVSCLSMVCGRGVGVCAGVFTQYISYRFFKNPYIHEDKPSLSICTLVYPVFPWCSGEVWGCALVLHSVYLVSVLWKSIHPWGQTISQCLHFGKSCLSMVFGRGVGVCARGITQYITYRLMKTPTWCNNLKYFISLNSSLYMFRVLHPPIIRSFKHVQSGMV